jgi:antitoxin MazE
MVIRLAKWGNSLAFRIPTAFATDLHATEGTACDLKIEAGRLVITPIEEVPVYDLNDLIAAMTDENRHEEIETGAAVGGEFA